MISSKVVLAIPILLATLVFDDLLTCLQPDFALCEEHLHGLAAEISLIFLPSLLTLLAVIIVSVYALKLQLRLAREIQPTVTLPPPPPASVTSQASEQAPAVGLRQIGRDNRDDIKIFNIEGVELEESQPREPKNNEDFDVRRLNSDPNSFFRVYCRGHESPAASSPTCFQPLSVVVERIMMLNIAALIMVLIFILTNCVRLYFIITREKCDDISAVLTRSMKFLVFLLTALYAVVIRKKLCT